MSRLARQLRRLARALRARWLRLAPGSHQAVSGPGHLILWNDARLHRCRVRISGANNRLEFGPGAVLWGASIELNGHGLTCRIGAGTRLRGGTYIVTDAGSALEIGDQTTMTGPMLVAQGGGAIRIGRDCMIAYGTDLRCSDGHSVIDAATGHAINPAADVRIGDHVWIGIHSQILKGAQIGDHAIVAARSVVTRPVPPGTIVAGNPARAIRAGVTWDRRRPPSPTSPLPAPHATLPL